MGPPATSAGRKRVLQLKSFWDQTYKKINSRLIQVAGFYCGNTAGGSGFLRVALAQIAGFVFGIADGVFLKSRIRQAGLTGVLNLALAGIFPNAGSGTKG